MPETLATREYEVSSFLINPQKRLGLYALLNLLQDAAWAHATTLGHGAEAMAGQAALWVLTRQRLQMQQWPSWGERVSVQTWLRPPTGPFVSRDFSIAVGGREVGVATTSWLLLDAGSRRPVRDPVRSLAGVARADAPPVFDAAKIELRESLTPLAHFTVRNSDLDLNYHVNNTRYAQWVLDSLPLESHRAFRLKEYEVNFLAETHAGDLITVLADTPGAGPEHRRQFQGWREIDGKTVFAARLVAESVG